MPDHSFGPFINDDSRLLILGSFPSVKSREASFYYANPTNRFFKVLAAVFDEKTGEWIELGNGNSDITDILSPDNALSDSDISEVLNIFNTFLPLIFIGLTIIIYYISYKVAYKIYNRKEI